MRNSPLSKLAEIASPGRGSPENYFVESKFRLFNSKIADELEALLSQKNGFVAFESALSVFSADPNDIVKNLNDWNHTLRDHMAFDNSAYFSFAEDLFLGQYVISEAGILKIDLESGESVLHSSSLHEWAEKILQDYNFETGYTVGVEWQSKNGRLGNGHRLVPKQPFALGGDYGPSNMVCLKDDIALGLLASLYQQIRDLPDGAQATVHDWNPESYA